MIAVNTKEKVVSTVARIIGTGIFIVALLFAVAYRMFGGGINDAPIIGIVGFLMVLIFSFLSIFKTDFLRLVAIGLIVIVATITYNSYSVKSEIKQQCDDMRLDPACVKKQSGHYECKYPDGRYSVSLSPC